MHALSDIAKMEDIFHDEQVQNTHPEIQPDVAAEGVAPQQHDGVEDMMRQMQMALEESRRREAYAWNLVAEHQRSQKAAPSFDDFQLTKLLDLKPPTWDGKGDIEARFIWPWRDFISNVRLKDDQFGLVAKILSSLPADVQQSVRAKRTEMEAHGEDFPASAEGIFALLLKLRPPVDRMRIALDKLCRLKHHAKLMDYNDAFLSNLNQLASLTVEQVKSYFYITGLTGEVRKEVEAKMNFRQHSYAEIMEYALATDARLRAASYSMKVHQSGPAASSTSTNNSGARHHRNEPTPMEIGSVKAQQSSNVSKGSQLKQDVKCHHCKKVGHIRRNCPDLKAEVK